MSLAMSNLRRISGKKTTTATPALLIAQLLALGYSFDEIYPWICEKPRREASQIDRVDAALKAYNNTSWFKRTISELRKDVQVSESDIEKQENANQYGSSAALVDPESMDFTKKDDIIAALSEEAKTLRGKERVDALIKLADLQQMKKEEKGEEKRNVMHYLPARCVSCPCWQHTREVFPDLKPLDL